MTIGTLTIAGTRLDLRSIKLAKSLSEETPAYTATLYVDGRKAASITNHGHGGPDMVHWTDRKVGETVDRLFKTLPKRHAYGMEFDEELEGWCHETVWNQDLVKTVRRSRKVSGVTADGQELQWNRMWTDLGILRTVILAKYPGFRFWSEMTDEEIVAVATKKQDALAE